jgi:uncharacterized repeat protein (TIGR03803 family)
MTVNGGTIGGACQYGCGTVFKLATNGTFTVLHAFAGGSDGAYSSAGLTADSAGNIYGATSSGGSTRCGGGGCGIVFKLAPDGIETVLHVFKGGNDGAEPTSTLIRGKHGDFYGETEYGGGSGCNGSGCGTLFKVTANGKESLLAVFGGIDAYPASLTADKAGNLYGAAGEIVFELTKGGEFNTLHTFGEGNDGKQPGSLMLDKNGNFYGVTAGGGTAGFGTVFELTPSGSETVLHSFAGGSGGYDPIDIGSLVEKKGNLFGTTSEGGDLSCNSGNGCGLVWELKK